MWRVSWFARNQFAFFSGLCSTGRTAIRQYPLRSGFVMASLCQLKMGKTVHSCSVLERALLLAPRIPLLAIPTNAGMAMDRPFDKDDNRDGKKYNHENEHSGKQLAGA
jgi:hypothetical protein